MIFFFIKKIVPVKVYSCYKCVWNASIFLNKLLHLAKTQLALKNEAD